MLRLFALLLVCMVVSVDLAAQTTADRESVAWVMERLIPSDRERGGKEVASHPETWSIVLARFAKGDRREVAIPAEIGESYQVIGASGSYGTDIDICVYGPAGDPVECDTLDDNYPVVTFTAMTEGTYRAVMTAASVEGGGTSFAGMIVLRRLDEGRIRSAQTIPTQ